MAYHASFHILVFQQMTFILDMFYTENLHLTFQIKPKWPVDIFQIPEQPNFSHHCEKMSLPNLLTSYSLSMLNSS